MSEEPLTAIVCSGGGMRSAHGGGFLYALATELGITSPSIMIGSSGDAGNVLYFAAGEYGRLKSIWTERLSTSKFISLLRFWRVMDIDYLVDNVFKKQEPMDVERLKKSSIRWLIPVSDYASGETRYVTVEDGLDPFEVLRASAATPVIYRKKISLDGKRYIDGELGPTLQDHITQALRCGAKRILIINHTTPRNVLTRMIGRAYTAYMPKGIREAIRRDLATDVFHISAPGILVIVVNPLQLPAGKLTRDRKKLQATFEQGIADAIALRHELQNLFQT